MRSDKLIRTAALLSIINTAYAVENIVLGFWGHSWWFITLGSYYMILSMARWVIILLRKSAKELIVSRCTGVMLTALSLPLLGIVILSAVKNVGEKFHKIVMISIALYTFIKITLAIINLVKARRIKTPSTEALRNISLADALVSVASLQRSMLVSFDGMTESEITVFNIVTGTTVSVLIFLIGLHLLGVRFPYEKKRGTQK